MNLNGLTMILAQATPAGQQQGPPAWTSLVTFGLMGVMLYFLFIRPQTKKAKDQANMMKTLKAGDKIITGSGIMGMVVSVKDKSVAIRSADSKLEVLKSAITDITERGGESSGSES